MSDLGDSLLYYGHDKLELYKHVVIHQTALGYGDQAFVLLEFTCGDILLTQQDPSS